MFINVRKVVFLAMLLAGSMAARADLVIVAGSQTTLPVVAVESISWSGDFNTGSLVFNFVDGQRVAVPFSQITQLKFAQGASGEITDEPDEPDSPANPDAIHLAESDSVCVSVSGDYLLLKGLPDGTPVSIFTLAGRRVARGLMAPCISLRALPAGTYIVQAGARSVKVIKR